MKVSSFILVFVFFVVMIPARSIASDSLSYSGRLVNADGSPVTGPVNLKLDLVYTNATGVILCSEDITNVGLTHGVFHVKFAPTCPSTTLSAVLAATPVNESVAIRVTDVTHSKTYSYQALHSMPFSIVSHLAKQIAQLGATNGQVLAWNNTTKQWEPTNAGAGSGTVTSITAGTGLDGGTITNTGTISIANGGVNTLQLAGGAVTSAKILDGTIDDDDVSATAGIARSKLAIGTPNYVLINDGTGAMSAVAQLPLTQGGTGASTAAGARTNLGLGTAATRDVYGTGDVITASSLPSTACLASEKLLWLIPGGWSCQADADSADATKLPLAGGTMAGAIDMNGNRIIDLPTPTDNAEAATKLYVDNAISGVGGSQWTTAGSNIYYNVANGNVGIGTTSPSQKLYVNQTSMDTSGAFFNIYSTLTLNPSANSSSLGSGIYATVNKNSSFDIDRLYGGLFSATNTSGNANQLFGTSSIAGGYGNEVIGGYFKSTSQGTTSKSVAVEAVATTESSSTNIITNLVALRGEAKVDRATTTVTSLKALDLSAPHTNGVVTDAYGIYIGTVGGATTGNRWGIYSSDTNAKSYHAGDMTFVKNIDVEGKVRLKSTTANYVELKAPSALGSTLTFNLPSSYGTNGYALTTDGAGNLSWSSVSGGDPTLGGDLSGTASNATIVNGAVTSAKILDGTIVGADIANTTIPYAKLNLNDGDIPSAKVNGLDTALSGKEPAITAGTTAQYWRGDKTWQTLDTDAVDEATNLYFTEDRVRGTDLFGLSIPGVPLAITASDTILSALGSLQGQITANDTAFDNTGQWSKNGTAIYFNAGNVGIGTSSPSTLLSVGSSSGAALVDISGYGPSWSESGILNLQRASNTASSPSATLLDHRLGALQFRGYDNDSFTTSRSAIESFATEDYTATNQGSDIRFSTTQNGENVDAERLRITHDGNLGIGVTAPDSKLYILSDIRPLTTEVIGTTSAAGLVTRRARGAIGSPSAVASGDNLGIFAAFGYGTSSYTGTANASISLTSAESFTDSARGTNILFNTTAIGTSTSETRMKIADDGKVGIGTKNPTGQLHVSGIGYTAIDRIGAGSHLMLRSSNGTIDTPTALLNDDKLGILSFQGYTNSGFTSNNTAGITAYAVGDWSDTNQGSRFEFRTTVSGTVAPSTRMTLDHTGYLGVGTVSPENQVHVSSASTGTTGTSIKVDNTASGASYLILKNDSTSWKGVVGQNKGNENTFGVGQFGTTSGAIQFLTHNGTAFAERGRFTPAGNFGIGDTNPTYKLDVTGDINSTTRLRIADVQVCLSTGCTASSDRRFKKNIKPLEDSYEKIMMLQGVEYDWKDTKKFNNQHQVGFIAQDLEKVFPEVVTTDKDSGYKSVSYDKLVAPLVEAFKELATRLGLVDKDVSKLKREIASVKEENEKVKMESQRLKEENAAIKAYLCSKDPAASICK